MSKEFISRRRNFASSKQTKEMNTFKNNFSKILVFLPLIFSAQTAPDLQELINAGLAKNHLLEQQKLETKYTELDQEKLKDIFLPKLEISGKFGYMNTTAHLTSPEISIPKVPPVFPGMTITEQKNNYNISGFSGSAKAEASVLLYSGGKVKYLNQALNEKKLSETALMQKTRDEVITEISKAYDQFALVHESKKVLDESKKRLDINKKTADKALGYGLITPYDHKKIELAQANLDSKMVEYEGKKELLITQLQILTGLEREKIAQINPELVPIQYEVLNKNVENRAEIQALEHGIKASEFKMKAENQWWQPKVQAVSSLSYFGLYDNHITSSENIAPFIPKKLNWAPKDINILPMFQIGIGFKWEIFDGKEGKSAVEKAKIDKEILQSKKSDAIDKLALNLANNQTNYDIANSQIATKAKARQIAKLALTQAEKEFRYGTIKSSQLIEAENDLESAELDYQTAVFNQRRSAVELMKSTQNLHIEEL